MSDTEKLDALLAAYNQAETLLSSILNHFERRALLPSNVTRQDVQEAVALLFERLDKQDRILAALREPSEVVVDTMVMTLYPDIERSKLIQYLTPLLYNAHREAIRASVEAAEQEVGQ